MTPQHPLAAFLNSDVILFCGTTGCREGVTWCDYDQRLTRRCGRPVTSAEVVRGAAAMLERAGWRVRGEPICAVCVRRHPTGHLDDPFLNAIWADPGSDLPRLVYADFLDDHGQPARAEFIRVQCALTCDGLPAAEVAALQTREAELLTGHQTELDWHRPYPFSCFDRGQPGRVTEALTYWSRLNENYKIYYHFLPDGRVFQVAVDGGFENDLRAVTALQSGDLDCGSQGRYFVRPLPGPDDPAGSTDAAVVRCEFPAGTGPPVRRPASSGCSNSTPSRSGWAGWSADGMGGSAHGGELTLPLGRPSRRAMRAIHELINYLAASEALTDKQTAVLTRHE